ncbi:MAG TPA: metal-dependent hydrolase [Longimicrobiales bacterium]|nr:metal-dependent hydrolase [Longimicrobiales bacterium]
MNKLTFHGHAAFSLTTSSGKKLLFDPWLDGNPVADIKTSDIKECDYILVSHGHGDHFADVVKLSKQTNATVIATYELAAFAESNGAASSHGMSIGGGHQFPFGHVKMTAALHGGGVDGSDGKMWTTPNGFWVDLSDARLYHAGDTALTMDMQLLQGRVDVALLPIGDNYTMGPEDAARAVEMIKPRVVIPMHYNTFDLIKQDPNDFKKRVGANAEVVVLKPGESFEF